VERRTELRGEGVNWKMRNVGNKKDRKERGSGKRRMNHVRKK